MDNPIDPVSRPAWQDSNSVDTLVSALEALGFQPCGDALSLPAMHLLCRPLLHAGRRMFAVVYERAGAGPWCEVVVETVRGNYYIATSMPREPETHTQGKTFEVRPCADPAELVDAVRELTRDHLALEQDRELLPILIRDRLFQHWLFDNDGVPAASAT